MILDEYVAFNFSSTIDNNDVKNIYDDGIAYLDEDIKAHSMETHILI